METAFLGISKIPTANVEIHSFLFICSKIVSQCQKFVPRKAEFRVQTERFSVMQGGRKQNSYAIPVWSSKTVLEMIFVEYTSLTWRSA